MLLVFVIYKKKKKKKNFFFKSDFSGCRKSSNSSRSYTIELILSNSTTLYLAAKSEAEASEWLQSFCKTISLGVSYNKTKQKKKQNY